MEQLKNSGGLRLLGKRNATEIIIIYDAKVSALEKLEERELQLCGLLPNLDFIKFLTGLTYDNYL